MVLGHQSGEDESDCVMEGVVGVSTPGARWGSLAGVGDCTCTPGVGTQGTQTHATNQGIKMVETRSQLGPIRLK